jgi:hypothetical protein
MSFFSQEEGNVDALLLSKTSTQQQIPSVITASALEGWKAATTQIETLLNPKVRALRAYMRVCVVLYCIVLYCLFVVA